MTKLQSKLSYIPILKMRELWLSNEMPKVKVRQPFSVVGHDVSLKGKPPAEGAPSPSGSCPVT